jgi:hypothetical protein
MFSRYLSTIIFIVVLFLFPLVTLLAQDSITLIVFPDEDSFTVYLPGNGRVSLEGIGFEAVVNGHLLTVFLQDQPSFSIRFDAIPRPICFHFMRPDQPNARRIPSVCPKETPKQELEPSDVFWIDSQNNRLTVSIVQHSQTLDGFCPAQAVRCEFVISQSTPGPTDTLRPPVTDEVTEPPETETIEPPPTPTDTPTNTLIVKSFDDNPGTEEAGKPNLWGRLTELTRIDLPEEYMTISDCPKACGWWTSLDDQYRYSDYECIGFEAYTSNPGGDVTVQIDFKVGPSDIIDNPTVVIKAGTWSTYSVAYSLIDALNRRVDNIHEIAFLVISNASSSAIYMDSIRLEDCPEQNQ